MSGVPVIAPVFPFALQRLPAFLVYTAFSTGTIQLMTLLSMLYFHERIAKQQPGGLFIILSALVLFYL